MKQKLAIITTHPIQYNAPWFRLLSERNNISVKVFYTLSQWREGTLKDPGFGKTIEWDIPLLDGYEFKFITNTSKSPGTRRYGGIVNPTLVKAITSWSPTAVLIFGWNFKSHLQCLRYFHRRIPVFFRGDSTLLGETPGFKKVIRNVVLTWVYKHIDAAFFVGTHNKDYFMRHGLKAHQLILAAHAIDNRRYMQPEHIYSEEAGKWRQSLGIPENNFVVLYAGKFEEAKNVSILIEVAKRFTNKDISFVLAGNGPMETSLKETSGSNVFFLAFQNQQQMPVLYRMGDLFVLPSKSETWGLAVNEAMACSRAVLVSDKCGCAADLVEEGRNGYCFISGDVDDLAHKISLMLKQKAALKEMGHSSFKMIEHFTFEKIAESIEGAVLKRKQ